MRSSGAAAVLALLLGGCASSPPTRIFVLGSAAADNVPVGEGRGRPVWLRPVLVPDYLDTTDILLRTGIHEVAPSRTGRWAERLSSGVTHALLQDLAARLPQAAVTLDDGGQDSAVVSVTVDAFDILAVGRCVLSASWTVAAGRGAAAAPERAVISASFAAASPGGSVDTAIVAAMADDLDRLADRLAAAVHARPGAFDNASAGKGAGE